VILHLRAFAKLNLGLRILGRRADGYHLLRTLYHQIDLGDELWARTQPDPHVQLTVQATAARCAAPGGADNLVARAAQGFLRATGRAHGFVFHLHKRIPTGAGLGGGSSDAAAALRLCNALSGAPLDAAGLHAIARSIGTDVPFCLTGGSQWGSGVGDELAPAVDVPPRWFLLVVPPFDCPTAEVYKTLAAELNHAPEEASIAAVSVNPHRDSEVRDRFENDLETAAMRVRPELAALKVRVVEAGYPGVHMTGSGSTLFLAFDAPEGVAEAMQDLRELGARFVRLLVARSASGVGDLAEAPWPETG
jgi:4-diphosphocytidyl-2-C-methyl-D-erythritol kinase